MRNNRWLTQGNREALSEPALTRRRLLKLGAMAGIGCTFHWPSVGDAQRRPSVDRSLSFYNTHTGERLKATYWGKGKYITESLAEINQILRDHRTNEVKNIDTGLLNFLFALQNKLEIREPFQVISGYRSAETNAALRAAGSGVAKTSLHIVGKAIDIRTPGRDLGTLRKAAIALKRGGVGYYPRSNFVHVDIGRVRYW